MTTRILEVADRADLKRWIKLPHTLYRDDPYWVPPLIHDELEYFDRGRNPAFDVADVKLLLAEKDGAVAGRVCAIVNDRETEKLGHGRVRFGWFDAVNDPEVAAALLDAVARWGREKDCAELTGPHGFTDLDVEGLLIEGHDAVPTMAGSYSYPYYQDLLEGCGLAKDVDYVEYRSRVPDSHPLLDRFRKRFAGNEDYKIVTCGSRKELLSHAPKLWEVIEASFAELYGVVPLTPEQTAFYTKKYLGLLDPDFVKLAFTADDELVGFFVAMPNISQGLRKARGRLLPFGWFHLLRAYLRPDAVDFLLGGAKPDQPVKTILAMAFVDMYDTLKRRGVAFTETNHELEDNTTVNGMWSRFETVHFRRSRVFRKALA